MFYGGTLKSALPYGSISDNHWVSPKSGYPHMSVLIAGDTAEDIYI